MEGWSPALDVGHPEMDGEHRRLFGLTAQAAECLEREDPGGVAGAVSALFTGSEQHFEHEEALMVESGFAGLQEHRLAHRAFMTDFGKLRAELRGRGLSPLFRLWFGARFQDWLRFHIRGQDAQFYRHLRQWQEAQARAGEAKLIAESTAAAGPDPAAAPAPPVAAPDRKG